MKKKRILFINSVCGFGSTGKLVCELASSTEYDSLVCYGRKKYIGGVNSYKFANIIDNAFGAIRTILFDNNINICSAATIRLIKKIKEFNPDIIHLHNLHGYYVNIEMLFDFLKEYNKPVIWTLHDCWAFTGYCPHFDYAKCDKYMKECNDCKHRFSYPFSLFKQNITKEYHRKKEMFTNVNDLVLVAPSKWLKERIDDSFLKDVNTIIIHNGIDISKSRVNNKYDKFTVLAVANYWTKEKGLDELKKVISLIDIDIDIIVVGDLKDKDSIFDRCRIIQRTSNYGEIMELYSKSHVLMNPSLEDVFGLVNAEAQSCGTPVIAYNTGGISDTINDFSGLLIEKGDYKSMAYSINELKKGYFFDNKKIRDESKRFDINIMKNKYTEAYLERLG